MFDWVIFWKALAGCSFCAALGFVLGVKSEAAAWRRSAVGYFRRESAGRLYEVKRVG